MTNATAAQTTETTAQTIRDLLASTPRPIQTGAECVAAQKVRVALAAVLPEDEGSRDFADAVFAGACERGEPEAAAKYLASLACYPEETVRGYRAAADLCHEASEAGVDLRREPLSSYLHTGMFELGSIPAARGYQAFFRFAR